MTFQTLSWKVSINSEKVLLQSKGDSVYLDLDSWSSSFWWTAFSTLDCFQCKMHSTMCVEHELFHQNLKVITKNVWNKSVYNYISVYIQGFPIIFHGVEGRDEREGHSPSFFNLQEVQIVVEYLEAILEKRGGKKINLADVGIISPYRRQVGRNIVELSAFGTSDIILRHHFPFFFYQ